jgi:hypothetical protein
MAITFVSNSALVQHADSITAGYPVTPSAGHLGLLQVVSAHPDDPIPSTPVGWTRAGSFSGGGGTFGAGTGPRRLTWFVRVMAGGDAQPTATIPSGASGSVICGYIALLARSAGVGWLWAATGGEDTSSGTSFSAACSSALTFKAGDFAWAGYALPDSTVTMSAQAITATGVSFGAVTERADDAAATGNSARFGAASATVSSGSGVQAPTVAATLSSASTGAAAVLRLREDIPKGDITTTPQSVFPPRNLVAVTEMLAGDVVTATIFREVGGELTELRGASGVNVVGQDALVRVDGEQPFGVPVTYAARLVDSLGDESLVHSGPITSTVATDVISDAIRGIGAPVTLQSYAEKQRNRDATLFNVGGRTVVVSRRRSGPSGTIAVRTLTDEAGDALDEVLDQATEGVVLIRKQTTLARLDGYYAIPADTESPTWYDEVRYWHLEAVKVEGWADGLEAVGFTLQDLADNYATLQDLADDFTPGTLLDIAIYDFGG